jgi:DNA-binding XRE family transcriptional regulator
MYTSHRELPRDTAVDRCTGTQRARERRQVSTSDPGPGSATTNRGHERHGAYRHSVPRGVERVRGMPLRDIVRRCAHAWIKRILRYMNADQNLPQPRRALDSDLPVFPPTPVDAGSGRRSDRWTMVIDGSEVRRLRRQLGLSQKSLADQAHVGATTIVRLEQQDRTPCRPWTLARIAAALEIRPDAIIARPDD